MYAQNIADWKKKVVENGTFEVCVDRWSKNVVNWSGVAAAAVPSTNPTVTVSGPHIPADARPRLGFLWHKVSANPDYCRRGQKI